MGTTETPSQQFGRRLKAARQRRGWSAQRLSDEVAELGGHLARGTLAKVEAGLRDVSLDEAWLLAYAVGTHAGRLLVPERHQDLELTPELTVAGDDAAAWLLGDHPMRDPDEFYYREALPWQLRETIRAVEGQRGAAATSRRLMAESTSATNEQLRRVDTWLERADDAIARMHEVVDEVERDPHADMGSWHRAEGQLREIHRTLTDNPWYGAGDE